MSSVFAQIVGSMRDEQTDDPKAVVVAFRCSEKQREFVMMRGGSNFIRGLLEKYIESENKEPA